MSLDRLLGGVRARLRGARAYAPAAALLALTGCFEPEQPNKGPKDSSTPTEQTTPDYTTPTTDTGTPTDTTIPTDTTYNTGTTSTPGITDLIAQEDVPFTYTLETGGEGTECVFTMPPDLPADEYTINGCEIEALFSNKCAGKHYDIGFTVTDEGLAPAFGTLSLDVMNSNDPVTLAHAPGLEGLTSERLGGDCPIEDDDLQSVGDTHTATLTPDGALAPYVVEASADANAGLANYTLQFSDSIDWSTIPSGQISGTATLRVEDSEGSFAEDVIPVTVYAPVQVDVTVRTPDMKEAISGGYVSINCDNGDSIEGTVDALGNISGFLNASTTCGVEANDGLDVSEHAQYVWDHDFSPGAQDHVGTDGVGREVHAVATEIYDLFTPSDIDPAYGEESCHNGLITDSRELLLYGTNMKHKLLGDSGVRTYQRFSSEGPIKYWVSDETVEGVPIGAELYGQLNDAVTTAAADFNSQNPFGEDYFEPAATIDEANIVYNYGTSTFLICNADSDRLIGTYSSGFYCGSEISTLVPRTVKEEMFNAINDGVDLCGDSISSGGDSLTSLDLFVVDNVMYSTNQNNLERTF